MGTAVLNVIAVIGLVAVAAFIIVFLADLLLSVIDGKNGIFFKRKPKNEKDEVKTLEMTDELEASPKLIEMKQEEPKKVEGNVDLELAESERLALSQANEKMAQENEDLKQRISALEAKQAEETPAEVEEDDDDRELTDEELDKMYADLIADINKDTEDEDDEEEIIEEPAEEEKQEEPEEKVEEVVEPVEEEPKQDEEKLALEKQIEELRKQLEQEQNEKETLAKQLEEKPEVVSETVEVVEGDTLESLLAQKAELEERLKNANKELKANKKEYIPLARIKKTLQNDEAKLRRREAIVAKKKIVLFGVTNYVVDPEKEKELSEDLDQLEALRLSVQHCEEVMDENKDRYPLLENTNAILKTTVAHIKADIDAIDQKIAKLQGTGDDATTGADDTTTTDATQNN